MTIKCRPLPRTNPATPVWEIFSRVLDVPGRVRSWGQDGAIADMLDDARWSPPALSYQFDVYVDGVCREVVRGDNYAR